MEARVKKWGNSLALRIPRSFAAEVGLERDSAVDLALVDGALVVRPLVQPRLRLEDLLAAVTEDNLHGEIDSGTPVGGEEW